MRLQNLISPKRYRDFKNTDTFKDLTVLEALFVREGFTFYIIGGFTRSILMENPNLSYDIDITTSSPPDTTVTLLERLKASYKKNSIAVWDVGMKYGTVGLKIGKAKYEITTYRGEKYDNSTRKPVVVYGKDLKEDVIRRDFTINSIAMSVHDGQLFDYCGGISDIKNRLIKACRDPYISFTDDPLRILRCARFQSVLGFRIAKNMYSAATKAKVHMHKLSKERIAAELEKMLLGDHLEDGFDFLRKTGILEIILPEIYRLTKMTIKKTHPHKNVYVHTLKTVKRAKELLYSSNSTVKDVNRRTAVLFAALFHDIGKFDTKVEHDDGTVTFHNHNVVSAQKAALKMRELKLSKNIITVAEKLIHLHLRQYNYCDSSWSDSAVRRYIYDVGDIQEELFILINADNTGNSKMSKNICHMYRRLKDRIEEVKNKDMLTAIRPEMNGNEIMHQLGLKPSKTVGVLYRYLLELRIERGILGKDVVRKLLEDKYKEVIKDTASLE